MRDAMCTCVLHRWWIDHESSLLLEFPNGKPNPLCGLKNAWLVDGYEWISGCVMFSTCVWSANLVDPANSSIYCYLSMLCRRACFHSGLCCDHSYRWMSKFRYVDDQGYLLVWFRRISVWMCLFPEHVFLFCDIFRIPEHILWWKSRISTWFLRVRPLITCSCFFPQESVWCPIKTFITPQRTVIFQD